MCRQQCSEVITKSSALALFRRYRQSVSGPGHGVSGPGHTKYVVQAVFLYRPSPVLKSKAWVRFWKVMYWISIQGSGLCQQLPINYRVLYGPEKKKWLVFLPFTTSLRYLWLNTWTGGTLHISSHNENASYKVFSGNTGFGSIPYEIPAQGFLYPWQRNTFNKRKPIYMEAFSHAVES